MRRAFREWGRSLADVRPEERRPAALMFAYGFLVMTSHYVLKPVRNSVFVDRLGADDLPWAYVATAVFVTVAMLLYSRWADRVGERILFLGTLLFLALNLLGFRWWLEVDESLWSSGAFYVWGKASPLLLVSQFYLVGNCLFNTRQARRLFGPIGVGLVLGGIAGGSVAGWGSRIAGAENLLLLAAGILVVCAGLVLALRPWTGGRPPVSPRLLEEIPRDAVRILRGSSHLRTIAVVLGLTVLVGTFVDWEFNRLVEEFVPGVDAKTAFFGKFFVGMNAAAVGIQLLLTGFLLRRLGVGLALLALPVALLVASIGVLALPALLTATLAKGTDGALRYSLDQSSRELLYLPVPGAEKVRVKPLIDLVVYRGATGVGGIVLIVVVNLLSLPWEVTVRVVAALAAAGALAWILAALRIRGEFRSAIRRLIGVQDVELDELIVQRLDAGALREIRDALERGDEEEVFFALSLLTRYAEPRMADAVAGLLDHPAARVRARAVEVLLETEDGGWADSVGELLTDSSLEVRVQAVRYLCRFAEGGARAAMEGFLEDPDVRVRTAATACLLRHGEGTRAHVAGETIRGLAEAEDPETRAKAAAFLGSLPALDREARETLRQLFDDEGAEVRRAAMRAAADAGEGSLVPRILDRLASPRDYRAAREALRAYGRQIHEMLLVRLGEPDTLPGVRRALPALLYADADPATVDRLWRLLPRLDDETRFETLKTLNKLRRNRPELDFSEYEIDDLVEEEVRRAHRWSTFRHAMDPNGGEPSLLRRTLAQRELEAAERASRLLGLRYPLEDLYAAFAAMRSPELEDRQQGFELLESTLPRRYRRLFDPLLDPDRPLAEVAAAAQERYELETPPRTVALRRLADEDDYWITVLARRELGGGSLEEEAPLGRHPVAGRPDWRPVAPWGPDLVEQEVSVMEIVDRAEVLRKTEIFEDLRTEELAGLAALVEERAYEKGETVFEQGGTGCELFIVLEGCVVARRGKRTLFRAEAGQTVGDLSLLDGRPRDYRAEAVADSRVLVLSRESFYSLMEERSRIARAMLSHLSRVIRRLNRRLEEAETPEDAGGGAAKDREGGEEDEAT